MSPHVTRVAVGALLAAIASSATAPAAAQDSPFAAGVGVGTTGLEAQGAMNLGDRVALRGAANFLNIDRNDEFDDIDYDAELEGNTVAGFVDFRPFANAFTVTGGAYFGSRDASLTGTPTTDVEIGDTTYTPAQVGSLVGKIDLGDFAPFVGLGFDNTFTSGNRIGFRINAGVALGDDPDVSLNSVGGLLSADPTLQAELAKEEANISDDADFLKYYPVASVGVFFRF